MSQSNMWRYFEGLSHRGSSNSPSNVLFVPGNIPGQYPITPFPSSSSSQVLICPKPIVRYKKKRTSHSIHPSNKRPSRVGKKSRNWLWPPAGSISTTPHLPCPYGTFCVKPFYFFPIQLIPRCEIERPCADVKRWEMWETKEKLGRRKMEDTKREEERVNWKEEGEANFGGFPRLTVVSHKEVPADTLFSFFSVKNHFRIPTKSHLDFPSSI